MHTNYRAKAGRKTVLPETAPKGVLLGLKTTFSKGWHATTNLAEDIVILGQFAFGREYIRRPVS